MKVLLISEYFPATKNLDFRGGMEARAFYVASYLSGRHRVCVICSREKNQPKSQQFNGFSLIRVGMPRVYSRQGGILPRLVFMAAVIREGLLQDFDLVEGAGFFSWLPAQILGLLKKRPRVAVVADTIESYGSDSGKIFYSMLRIFEKFVLRLSWSKVVCISHTVKVKVVKLGVGQSDVEVIHLGADLDLIKNLPTKKNRVPTVCCIARLVPYKHVGDLLQAISILRQKNIILRTEIIGTGEEREKLEDFTKQEKIDSLVKFRGYLPNGIEVLTVLKTCMIFCLPSTVEGFGIVTVEALAAGLPVVLVDIPINREVTKGKGALFYSAGNSRELAEKLKTLLTNQQLFQRLKTEGGKVANFYDWSKTGKLTEGLYTRLTLVCPD